MSRSGELTLAVAMVGAALWNEVQTLRASMPRPIVIVDIYGETSPGIQEDQAGAWRIALPAGVEIVPSLSRYPESRSLPALRRLPSRVLPIFVDRFQSLDERDRWAISDGWSNGAWTANDWRREQLATKSGAGLLITLAANRRDEDKPFTSGEISTHEIFRYGYFETRFRMPRGSGLVAGVFTFTREGDGDTWDEIDIEMLGRDTRSLELTYFSSGREHKHIVALPFDAADAFHTYAFDWRPDAIRWYVDDQLVHEARGADIESMTRPQRFIVNLWNSEQLREWVGPIEAVSGSWTLNVTCVAHAAEYPGQAICEPE